VREKVAGCHSAGKESARVDERIKLVKTPPVRGNYDNWRILRVSHGSDEREEVNDEIENFEDEVESRRDEEEVEVEIGGTH
jgi:hypothetical protein